MHKSTLTPRNILKSLYLLLFLSVASTLCAQVTFLEESTITDEGLYFWYPNGVKAYHYNPNISPWGDHGYKLGEYGAWCKHTNLELDTHVPFMVSAPGFPKGKRSDASVEIVDIFPTLAKLTGGKIPQSCDGQSLEPVLNNPAKEFRPYALSMYPKGSTTGYTMRTDRWRYTEWIQAHTKKIIFRELYDHKDSQLATQNLAKNPEHQDLIAHLSEQLDSPTRIATSKVKYKK